MEITKSKCLTGELSIPGDKSISHRGVMFGALSHRLTEIFEFSAGSRLSLYNLMFSENGS